MSRFAQAVRARGRRSADSLSAPAAFVAGDLLAMGLVMLAVDRAPEIMDAAAYGAACLGQPLRSEHKQRDHENQEKMRGLDNVANHVLESTA
jgi:hypothetical protein